MNRFIIVFLAAVFSCSYTFSQSTNIVGAQSVDLSGLQFSGSGPYPSNYAANVESVTSNLLASGSSFTGGAGGTTDEDGGSSAFFLENGGTGLQMSDVGQATLRNSTFSGGEGGSATARILAGSTEADGGHGISFTGIFDVNLEDGVTATGGDAGYANNPDGKGSAHGGDAVHGEIDDIAGTMVISNGTYQGGAGGTFEYNSTFVDSNPLNNIKRDQNGARGGHGLYIFTTSMYRDQSRALTITDGTFVGGDGGTAVNDSASGDVIADGGSGIFVSSMSDVQISGGTFIGGTAGTTNGSAAMSGPGAVFWDSNVDISSGDFQGDELGLFFSSYFYAAALTITSGRFDNVEIASFDGGFGGSTAVDISGGEIGDATFGGDNTIDATLSGGTFGDFTFLNIGTKNISMTSNVVTSGTVVQDGGIVNVSQWTDSHFMDTTVLDGDMNFSGQAFNLEDGSSFALSSVGSTVDFGGGFTARSNSMITTAFDEPSSSSSKIEGTSLEFEQGVQWIIDGGDSAIAAGDNITMATASGTLINNIDPSDVEYMGTQGSWLGGIVGVNAVGNDLVGSYGFVPFEDALDLDPNTEVGKAMAALSAFTGISTNSGYTGIKDPNLSEAQAYGYLKSGFAGSPEMASTLIRVHGLFADQITDRTRSFRRYSNWGGSTSYAPLGARGPAFWDESKDSSDASLASAGLGSSRKKDYNYPPDTARNTIDVPETYQVWGRGYGSFFSQGDVDDFGGYDATIGGGVLGVDKRFSNLLIGVGGGYAYSDLKGNWGSNGEADTLYGTVYAAANVEYIFIEANVNYAFNDVETEGSQVVGGYEGEFDANSASLYVGGGMGLPLFEDSLLITPEISLLSTYYDREGYNEIATSTDGVWPTKTYDGYDQWSYLSSLGVTLSMMEKIDSYDLEMAFQPEIRAHWLHEFNAEMDNETYVMESSGAPGTPLEAVLQAREEDLVKIGTGVRFSRWNDDTLELGLDFDAVFGEDYEAYIGSAKLLHRF